MPARRFRTRPSNWLDPMNSDRLKGNWNELKGLVKEKWGRLTDDELRQIDGSSDRLVGALQKAYGLSRDEARKELNGWLSR